MKSKIIIISKRIKHWRGQRGLTQDGLAKKANLTVSSVSKLESGHISDPRLSTVIHLAEALEITIEELINE